MIRILIFSVLFTTACKTRTPSSVVSETKPAKVALGEAICIDPEMLVLSNSAQAQIARYMGPAAASAGMITTKPLDAKTIEPRISVLNQCLSGATSQTINLKFSFAKPYDTSNCRCVISSGLAPDAFIPALSCGADEAEAKAPSCMLVRRKGCAETNIKRFVYAPTGKRLSCINRASELFPKINIFDFRDGNTDDMLLAVLDKTQLSTPKCDAAAITKQQWDVFVERRPGFAKNAEIFGAADIPGNIISCADPEDVKWFQSKAFSGEGIDHPCFATARSGFGSCAASPTLAKAFRKSPSTPTSTPLPDETIPTPTEDEYPQNYNPEQSQSD